MIAKMIYIHMTSILTSGINLFNKEMCLFQDLELEVLHLKIACISLAVIKRKVEITIKIFSSMISIGNVGKTLN
jgi:hypothetical protein